MTYSELKLDLIAKRSEIDSDIDTLVGTLYSIEREVNNIKLMIDIFEDKLSDKRYEYSVTLNKNKSTSLHNARLSIIVKEGNHIKQEIESLHDEITEKRESYRYYLNEQNLKYSLKREINLSLNSKTFKNNFEKIQN